MIYVILGLKYEWENKSEEELAGEDGESAGRAAQGC